MRLRGAGASSAGRRRWNEDAFLVRENLFAVADGMGGNASGRPAADLVLAQLDERCSGPAGPDPGASLVAAVQEANRALWLRSSGDSPTPDPLWRGSGATLVAARGDTFHVAIAHVGDCRAYLLRAGLLRQLTVDHLAPVAPRRVVAAALGMHGTIGVDVCRVFVAAGDVLLLCSDGLTLALGEDEIAARLAGRGADRQAAASELVAAAAAATKDVDDLLIADNVTAIVCEVEGVLEPG